MLPGSVACFCCDLNAMKSAKLPETAVVIHAGHNHARVDIRLKMQGSESIKVLVGSVTVFRSDLHAMYPAQIAAMQSVHCAGHTYCG